MSAPLSIGRIFLHALGLMVVSVLMSGNGNVLPQLFFQRNYPEAKLLWLSGCLLLGAFASTAGVLVARSKAAGRGLVAAALLGAAGAELGLFFVGSGPAYLAVNAALQFLLNYLVSQLDLATVARAGDARRGANDGVTNLMRLLGMLAAPILYSALYDQREALFGVLAVGAALTAASTAALYGGAEAHAARAALAADSAPAERRDRLFFAYAIALYSALYLLAANLTYLMRDVVRLEHPELKAGTTISLVFGSAVLGNLAATVLARGAAPGPPRALPMLVPAAVLAALAGLIGGYDGLPYAGVLAGGAVLGFSYGFFLLEVRRYASRGAREEKKSVLLTFFNNMANLSSIVGFALLMLIAATGAGARSYTGVLLLIGLVPVAAAPLFWASRPRSAA